MDLYWFLTGEHCGLWAFCCDCFQPNYDQAVRLIPVIKFYFYIYNFQKKQLLVYPTSLHISSYGSNVWQYILKYISTELLEIHLIFVDSSISHISHSYSFYMQNLH